MSAPSPAPQRRRGRSRTREALSALFTGVMAGLIGVIVLLGVAAIVVPAATGSTTLTVLTSSMEPDFPAGTLVVVRPTDVADIGPGDVITYQLRSGEPEVVTHRVLQQHRTADGEPFFITQGDANPSPDPEPVQPVQVRGTVWYAIPWLGHVAQWVSGDVRAVVVPVAVVGLFAYAGWMFLGGLRDRARGRSASS